MSLIGITAELAALAERMDEAALDPAIDEELAEYVTRRKEAAKRPEQGSKSLS